MVASHAAGLRIASHSCVTVYARAVHPSVRRVLRRFPVVCSETHTYWSCTGLPAHVLDRIGRHVAGGEWGQDVHAVANK
eukprot:6465238-Lingulodinium_polyedra.AAC.1